MNDAPSTPSLMLPLAPAIVCSAKRTAWLTPDGEIESLSHAEVAKRLKPEELPIVCHAPETARKLGLTTLNAFDVLELFAFVRPARFVLPTPRGLAEALNLALPGNLEREAESLIAASGALLVELAERANGLGDVQAGPLARVMALSGWPWAQAVLKALGEDISSKELSSAKAVEALKVWNHLPEWDEIGLEPTPGNKSVDEQETRTRLIRLIGNASEKRDEQVNYSISCSDAFQPRDQTGEPQIVLAEAGTGVGKTLGYIAPASIWAEKNDGTVWISTFTRNLQRQLDFELDRLFPEAQEKASRVVIRKGRENYFCLLNYEESLNRNPATNSVGWKALGLMARWTLNTRDGDMRGGDFPSWLKDLLGTGLTTNLTDTRGECIYSGCRHYRRCFVEHTVRRAESADIVVANHALVMFQGSLGSLKSSVGNTDIKTPIRYIFDEGHHLFSAADNAFSAHLTIRETAELRRWLVGTESIRRTRSRGLRERIKDLTAGDEKITKLLDEVLQAAKFLPASGWIDRLGKNGAIGLSELFFTLVRTQVYARDANEPFGYSLETDTVSPINGLIEAALNLEEAFSRLRNPLGQLIGSLTKILDIDSKNLDSQTRNRIENVCQSLDRRACQPIDAWLQMLKELENAKSEGLVDWLGIERVDGHDIDIGLHRHWIDPTKPFIETVIKPAHGVVITSATLRDSTGNLELDWKTAEQRTGVVHLEQPASLVSEPSPFDYINNTIILIVDDVTRNNKEAVASAYRELFLAAGGGGLGLFTAISRLRDVAKQISNPLEKAGVKLLAQHVDSLDTGTLVDIFRAEKNSCLLGTDAVRDGVDVPGDSLRLIVFDRVPWPRPNILHKNRRIHFGGKAYDDMLTRAKLKQAYGRLVRRTNDKGVFVMLDKAMPSRLLGSFPTGVQVKRIGLKEAIILTRNFFNHKN